MIAHAGMRENTVQREPKSVRYTIFGKALFTFLLILILVIGFMVVQRVAEVKKANAQHTLSNPTSK
ncbi:MAG: hypothetical protein JWR38_823 [Mucilaginibacter sp.]|nr:hypothetical protein [Mucilaginibacter sp.]